MNTPCNCSIFETIQLEKKIIIVRKADDNDVITSERSLFQYNGKISV